MKIRNLILACMIYFAMSSISIAAGIGNFIIPLGDMNVAVSAEGNFIMDKDFELSGTTTSFEYDSVSQAYGKFSLGVTEYVNVYAKVGSTIGGEIKQKFADKSTLDIETKTGTLWGVGCNGSYPIVNGLSLGIDFQYNEWKCTVDEIEKSGQVGANISGKIKSEDCQLALFLSKKINLRNCQLFFIPYAGGIYSWSKSKTDDVIKYEIASASYQLSWSLDGDDSWGVVGGTDIAFGDNFAVNVEGRLIDETAFTAGASWKF